ncbi:FeoA family protein [Bacillus sp. 03113]|uniref:FeoA family protein n=1 Tax=Bacillus sp. 03113 TaxID=2578211 RepID=UPI0015E8AA74|nr:FeoA family protein [Bacillus sp. 03113]
MYLDKVSIGIRVSVKNSEFLNPSLERRLLSFGLKKGSELCMKQKAFLGGPCVFECQGQMISIRKCDAAKIEVENL